MKTSIPLLSALCASLLLSASIQADTLSVSTSGVVVYTIDDGGEAKVLPGMSFGSGTKFVTATDSAANFALNQGSTAIHVGPASSMGVQILDGDGSGALDLLFGRMAGDVNGGSEQVVRTKMGNIVVSPGSRFTASLLMDATGCAVLSITNLHGSVSYVALLAGDDTSIEPDTTTIIRVCEGDPDYAAISDGLPEGDSVGDPTQAYAFYQGALGADALADQTLFAPLFTDDAALTVVSPELGIE